MGGKTYRFCNLRKWKDFKNNNTKKKKKTAYLTQNVSYVPPVWSMGRFIAVSLVIL